MVEKQAAVGLGLGRFTELGAAAAPISRLLPPEGVNGGDVLKPGHAETRCATMDQ